ncbi:MAG: family 78 glycoside hydrolase catalytic domain, partial [Clostridia bacterium]|nr:family 78 glycoside hydrolase catalytic domain [Clostridia bacterium]
MLKNAKWIAESDNIKEITPAPLFRKSFSLSKTVKKATMYACGLGHACYYINGRNITDEVMITPISKYDSRVYYNEFDVTEFLSEGKNTIGCVLGNGWYFVTYPRWDFYKPAWMHHPKLILKLVIEYTDGSTEEIVSDTSWKTAKSAIIYNEDKRGEIYDARLYIDGWNEPDFDDSRWNNAFICRGAGGVLQKMDFPPIRVTDCLPAVRISSNVYDIGQNISGWVRLKVRGERGCEVKIRYSEVINEDGSIAPERLNTIAGSDTRTDKYILSGRGVEEWAPSFAYHGFRYAEITGDAEIIEVIGEVVHSDVKTVGAFECSDDMLNKIHSASVWSTLTNIQGIITDCTQREQNGWTGDALLSAEQSLMNLDIVPIYKKWLVDIRDTQRPNGQICCLAPTSGWGYNWGSGPAWDSALILIPYYIYKYTGDKSVLAEMWESMALYMEFME